MDSHAINVYARGSLGTFLTPGKYTADTKAVHDAYKSLSVYVTKQLFERKLRSTIFFKRMEDISVLIEDTRVEVEKTGLYDGAELAYAAALVYASLGKYADLQAE